MTHEHLKAGMNVLLYVLGKGEAAFPSFVQLADDPFTTDGRNYYANVVGGKKPYSLEWMEPLPTITEQNRPLFIAEVSNKLDKIQKGISDLHSMDFRQRIIDALMKGELTIKSPLQDAIDHLGIFTHKMQDAWSKPAGNEGEWSIGRPGTVVSNSPTKRFGCIDEPEYYGGYLICESIPSEADARLIAAAPLMLKVLKAFDELYSEELSARQDMLYILLQKAISSAEDPLLGERDCAPKSIPCTHILPPLSQ